jgi:hypothetical protein
VPGGSPAGCCAEVEVTSQEKKAQRINTKNMDLSVIGALAAGTGHSVEMGNTASNPTNG